jgi:hypothetical protein
LWPVLLGLLVFSAVLVCWQPKEDVFLDKVCIHQTDLHKKQQGIDGLGGFLHHSDRMIIFWDRSYFKRLWCVFELAAYLYMKGESAKISVVPIIRGYVTVAAIFLNLARVVLTGMVVPLVSEQFSYPTDALILLMFLVWCVHLSRMYARDYIQMRNQIEQFVPQDAECFCCKVDHKMPITGAPISCDRECIYAAISEWYRGGLEEFQDTVRKTLFETVQKNLGSMYSYTDALKLGLPGVLRQLSLTAVHGVSGQEAISFLALFLYEWMCMTPMIVALVMVMSVVMQRERSTWLCDRALSSMLALPLAMIFLATEYFRHAMFNFAPSSVITFAVGVVLFASANLLLSARFFRWLLPVSTLTDPVSTQKTAASATTPSTSLSGGSTDLDLSAAELGERSHSQPLVTVTI